MQRKIMQNVIRPNFNQTPNITQGISYILQRNLPQEFLEGVQKIMIEKLSPEIKKNKLASLLGYCDSAVLSDVLALIIAEYCEFPTK